MESVELGLDDMFEERDIDEDVAIDQGMMDNEARAADDELDENGDLQSQMIKKVRDMSAGAAKKVIKKPQPKLDATRLNSDRGFPALRKIFEEVNFKRKGHEISDFLLMMRTMEHWAHRLFPKMTFDEVIDRCERLGTKQQVKTIIRKIRMGMPVLDNEFVHRQEDSEDEQNQQDRQDDGELLPNNEDDIDELLEEAGADIMDYNDDVTIHRSQAPPGSQAPPTEASPTSPPKSPVFGKSLLEEQRERSERNKMLALQKREARLREVAKGVTSQPTAASQTIVPESETSELMETEHLVEKRTENDCNSDGRTGENRLNQASEQEEILGYDILNELDDDFEFDEKSIQETESQYVLSQTESSDSPSSQNIDKRLSVNEVNINCSDLSPKTAENVINEDEHGTPLGDLSPKTAGNVINEDEHGTPLGDLSPKKAESVIDEGDNGLCELSPKIVDTALNKEEERTFITASSDLSPRMVDSVTNKENDQNTLNTDTEPGLNLCLDPDSSPISHGEHLSAKQYVVGENEINAMELDV